LGKRKRCLFGEGAASSGVSFLGKRPLEKNVIGWDGRKASPSIENVMSHFAERGRNATICGGEKAA